MKYVQVVVASHATVIDEELTYQSTEELQPGQIVRVPLKNRKLNGLVTNMVAKPKFKTKAIDMAVPDVILPIEMVELAKQVAGFWGVSLSQTAAMLVPRGVHQKRRNKIAKDTVPAATESMQPLTPDQAKALKIIENTLLSQTVTLHGDTGTGKTRVYIELTKKARQNGQGAIILVPEIGLTTQLVKEFETVFKDVFIQHSKMTERERHLQWLGILKHDNPVVVGPRSAVFAPVGKLGLIVVDESHEPAYKQDQTPKYSALRAARMRANLQKARLVLGSATPAVEDMFIAREKDLPILRMTKLATNIESEVDIKIIDSSEVDNRGQLITRELNKAILKTLKNKQQVLVFHNRRGSSTSVICENCGDVSLCPTCHVPLVHHHDLKSLKCHICGYQEKTKLSCSACGEAALRYRGFGTKQIESEVKKLFPTASIARFDSDVAQKMSLDNRYDELKSGKIDIIIGTQMIAKGLDLPKLGLVAVPAADTLLYLPDFSASERFFQLVYQVVGRVGRHGPGEVVIQTYNPKQPVLKAAITRNYEAFYEQEVEERRLSDYPPFTFLLSLVCTRKKLDSAESAALGLAETIAKKYPELQVLGPAPAFHERTRQGFRWQIVVKSKDRTKLLNIVRSLPANWQFDIDPANLLT